MTGTKRGAALTCMEVLALLDRFVDGELSDSELAAVRLHVANCSRCAEFVDRYASTINALRSFVEDSIPEGSFARVLPRLREVK